MMKSNKYYLAAGAIMCSAFMGLTTSSTNTFASTIIDNLTINTGFNDKVFFGCVVDKYMEVNGVDLDYIESLDASGDPLPAEGLANITELACQNKHITDITGISTLSNLDHLLLNYNDITSADISHNSKLQVVSFGNNQLTAINTSGLTNLDTLDISNNSITSLDVSSNTNLQKLYTSDNPLTAIDVSQNDALEWLTINNTSITELDLSHNPSLGILMADNVKITTTARAKKIGDNYVFDFNNVQFLTECIDANSPCTQRWVPEGGEGYTYDAAANTITVSNRDKLSSGFKFVNNDGMSSITISANPTTISIGTNVDGIALSDVAMKYVGETWDSNEYLDTINAKLTAHNIKDATLKTIQAHNRVSASEQNSNTGQLAESTNTHIFGVVPMNARNIVIVYNYELPEVKTPNTGAFTTDHNGVIAITSVAAISAVGSVAYVSRYAAKRQKSKIHFNKK